MKRLLACAIMLILAKACGVEEPYETDFISITQADKDRFDRQKIMPNGAHANAYLINKVHKKDHKKHSSLWCTILQSNGRCECRLVW